MDLFDVYWLLLVVSGILLLGLGFSGFGGGTKYVRAVNLLFGFGFIGYGAYLGLFFTGGHYVIFFQAFFVPILLIANAIRSRFDRPKATAMPVPPAGTQPAVWTPAPGQQPGYPAPTTPWQAPNQAAPAPIRAPAPLVGPTPAAAPTLTSDDVLGR